MSKGTPEADLFRWASRRRGVRAKWSPRRSNGFAAALAVILETARPPASARPAVRGGSGQRRRGGGTPRAVRLEPASSPGHAERARCPRCGTEGEVAALFGTRLIDGKRRPQSWCRACRRRAREAVTAPAILEAEAFARRTVRAAPVEVEVDDLPLWSATGGSRR